MDDFLIFIVTYIFRRSRYWLTLSRGMVNTTLVSGSILIYGGENWRLTEFPPRWGCRHFMLILCVFSLMVDLQAAIKSLRGGSGSRANDREQLIKVCFLLDEPINTVLAPI